MSDSFADLWNSSAPVAKPQTMGSMSRSPAPTSPATMAPNNAYRRQDAFSMLSSAGSSTSSSRSTSTVPKSTAPSPKPSTTSANSSGDAFGALLAGAISAKPAANMTMAERAALAEKTRREASMATRTPQSTSSAWDGLDSLGGVSSTLSPTPAAAPVQSLDDDWGLGDFGQPPKPSPAAVPAKAPSKQPVHTADDDGWGVLDDFGKAPTSSKPSYDDDGWGQDSRKQGIRLDDEDDFGFGATRTPLSRRSDSPSNDFDFGNREDGLLGADDILGDLAKPAEYSRRTSPAIPPRREPSPRTKPLSRPVSPPPHILGRIVEMGFSIQQARIALAATDSGVDVEAALETLLSNGASNEEPRSSPPPSLPRRPQDARSPPRRREAQASPSEPERSGESNLQEQADKIIAQASTLGLSFFNKANAAWKEGRDRVQKAYAERTAEAGTSSGRGSPANGRPKWMQSEDGFKDDAEPPHTNGSSFRDDTDSQPQIPRRPPPPSSEPRRQQPPAAAPAAPVGDLLSVTDDAPAKPYVSPFRRKAATPAPSSAPVPSVPAPAPARSPSKPLRKLITAPMSSISTSRSHKDDGANKFKLGQYGDAEASYSRAIECLPAGHLLLIPLYNNRALVRLKTGDYSGAASDSGTVIDLVDESTWQEEQARTKSTEEGAGVDFGDSLVKAWKRRAESLEGREKWDEARKDWERVAGAGWAPSNLRGDGVRGAGRCRKMVAAEKSAQDPAPPPPKPKPVARPPVRRGPTPPSQAAVNLKKANAAAAAEDDQKHQLKDTVDAKLLAWKGGKESNIRALIASLDTVLWPELGLQKTSIAELVTPAQVKIRYTKAIAKLHPDKLNANNSTLEQRMIANGVFGTLNEAWNAFKQ